MQSEVRNPIAWALTTSVLTQWLLLLLLFWVLSKQTAIPIAVATLALAIIAFCLWRPLAVVYTMIVLGPFYDITRAFLFPGVELLGFWQDAFVAILLLAAARNVMRDGLPKLILLDKWILGFIASYAFSIVVSADNLVWFYGFRWFVLYPVMYLTLRTFRFTPQQERRIVAVLATSLVVSAALGLFEIWYLGWDTIVELDRALKISVFKRDDLFRWASTFTSPIIASNAFALLFLVFAALTHFTSRRFFCLLGCAFAIVCIWLTHSRSGVVIATVGLLVILFAIKSAYRKPLLIASVIAASFVVYYIARTIDEWDMVRLQQFSRTITESITTYPLGTGAGTAGAVSIAAAGFAGYDSEDVDTVVGDSVALTVLRDTGWPGAICFVGICFSVITLAWRARTAVVGMLALAYWVGCVVNLMNSTDVYPTKVYLWLFAALAAAVAVRSSDPVQRLKSNYAAAHLETDTGVL